MTCTTHHHACACREARFEAMFQAQEAHVERLEAALLDLIDSNASTVTTAAHVKAAIDNARAALASRPKGTP